METDYKKHTGFYKMHAADRLKTSKLASDMSEGQCKKAYTVTYTSIVKFLSLHILVCQDTGAEIQYTQTVQFNLVYFFPK